MIRQHPLLTALTVLYLGGVAWMTLGPQPTGVVHAAGIWQLLGILREHPSLAWIRYSDIEFAANVAMFAPLGLFLLLLLGRRRWWIALLAGPLLSLGIETAQLFIPGRVSDVRDLVSNSIGTVLGLVAGLVITWPAAVRRRRAARTRTGEMRLV
ncbi:VanZ family protein [Pseudolysinimonas sp.]|uniref:VanZ family protein n=1 Tax=Pseudolysinimonas sp. TaxID=2680009 RepID=UPI003F7EF77F